MSETVNGYTIAQAEDGKWEASCSHTPETFATNDKKSIEHYVQNYQLCEDPAHTPETEGHWYTR